MTDKIEIMARQEKTISVLNRDIDMLKTTNRELEEALAVARANGRAIGNVVLDNIATIEKLETDLCIARGRINTLETDLDNAETHIKALESNSVVPAMIEINGGADVLHS